MTNRILTIDSALRVKAQSVTLTAAMGQKNNKPAFAEWAEKIGPGDRLPRGHQFKIIQRWRSFYAPISTKPVTVSTLHVLPE